MKTIFKSDEIEVLSLDGLKYTTTFTEIDKAMTHFPYFTQDKELYISLGEQKRRFFPGKSVYAFRYYDENGNLSPAWTATFCTIEGEEGECVVLGRYAQSYDSDRFDSLSPYDDAYGCFDLWSSYPRVFSAEDSKYCRIPSLNRINVKATDYPYGIAEMSVEPGQDVKVVPVTPEEGQLSIDEQREAEIPLPKVTPSYTLNWCAQGRAVLYSMKFSDGHSGLVQVYQGEMTPICKRVPRDRDRAITSIDDVAEILYASIIVYGSRSR